MQIIHLCTIIIIYQLYIDGNIAHCLHLFHFADKKTIQAMKTSLATPLTDECFLT